MLFLFDKQINLFSYEHSRRQSKDRLISIIFVITDEESDDKAAIIRAGNILKQKDIVLVSVGVGNRPYRDELHALLSPPLSENYFSMSNSNAL